MMNNINIGKRISVGYNRSGQKFFDLIAQFKANIHSYFFNPSYIFSHQYPWTEQLKKMRKLNTYGIDGNILFNFLEQKTPSTIEVLEEFLKLENLNINSVTVIDQESIDAFKQIDPSLKFHISVHVPIHSVEDLKTRFNVRDVYCVNLANQHIFDMDLITKIHDLGIKVKLIANEMCAWDRNKWYNYFFGHKVCRPGYCGRVCRKLFRGELAWLNLTRQGYTKEFLPYFDDKLSIIKISTRSESMSYVKAQLNSFIMPEKASMFNRCLFGDGLPDSFIKKRLNCDHRCKECLFCKEIYDNYVTNKSSIFLRKNDFFGLMK